MHFAFPQGLRAGCLLTGAIVPLTALPAHAQSVPAPGGGLENVVVTAKKRKERLQDVPISVDAFSGRDLRQKDVTQPVKLVSEVPNLTTKNAVGDTAPIFSLRGISLNDFATNGTQPVGVYIDEVYLPNNSQL
jgi:iron complex outermembrane receptor protein